MVYFALSMINCHLFHLFEICHLKKIVKDKKEFAAKEKSSLLAKAKQQCVSGTTLPMQK